MNTPLEHDTDVPTHPRTWTDTVRRWHEPTLEQDIPPVMEWIGRVLGAAVLAAMLLPVGLLLREVFERLNDSGSSCSRDGLEWALLVLTASGAMLVVLILASLKLLPRSLARPLWLVPSGLFFIPLFVVGWLFAFGMCYTGH
jgi:hypothetical protein